MNQEQIELIITRVEAANSIEKKHIFVEKKGATSLVCSEDFGLVCMDENRDGPYLVMYQEDYDFVLHAPDDIRDLVEALEEAQTWKDIHDLVVEKRNSLADRVRELEEQLATAQKRIELRNKDLKEAQEKLKVLTKEFSIANIDLFNAQTEIIRLGNILNDIQKGFESLKKEN